MNNRGFTIIELVIFIVIMGIVGVTILASFSAVLKGVSVPRQKTIATQTAARCMEWYLEQRYLYGFNAATLSCPNTTVPSFCAAPSGYTITTSVSCTQLYGEIGANYKTITVTVGGASSAALSLLLSSY